MTALTPQQKELQRFARARAGQIRSGITNYIHTLGVIATAYRERDWEALGYESWQEYIDGEFPASRLGIPAEYREKAMHDLRLAGLSTRAIAPVVGVSHSTVARQVSHGETPEPVQGVDGKTYSPARSPVAEAMEQAIVDAQERAEDHRDLTPGEAEPVRGVATEPGSAAGEVGRSSQGQVPTFPAQDHRDERPGDAPDLTPANVGPGRTDVESPSVDPGPDAPPVAGPGSPNLCPLCGQPRDAYRPTQ